MQLERIASWPKPGERGIVWLGQAGFWIETGEARVLIDPYLSDSLAQKYADPQYAPAAAAERCGIAAETIERIARLVPGAQQ